MISLGWENTTVFFILEGSPDKNTALGPKLKSKLMCDLYPLPLNISIISIDSELEELSKENCIHQASAFIFKSSTQQ